jgi:hypothetical protein
MNIEVPHDLATHLKTKYTGQCYEELLLGARSFSQLAISPTTRKDLNLPSVSLRRLAPAHTPIYLFSVAG